MALPVPSRLTANEYRIDPTGVGANDTPAFIGLLNAIGTGKAGVVIADNGQELIVDGAIQPYVTILGDIGIRGETPSARIKFRNAFEINWGGYAVPPNLASTMPPFITRGTCNAVTVGAPKISSPSGVTFSKGDTAFLWYEGQMPDVEPHASGWTGSPLEVHRVERVSGSDVIFTSPVIDTMASGVSIAKVQMLRNCYLRNITISTDLDTTGTGNQTRAIDVFRTQDFVLENVTFADRGPGYIRIHGSVNPRVIGLNIYGMPNQANDYGLVLGPSMGAEMVECKMQDVRHPFTTSGFVVGSHRYGTVAFPRVHHNHVFVGGDGTNAFSVFDCHAEGYGVRFENNTVEATNPGLRTIGYSTRARKTVFDRCHFIGANDYWGYAFVPYGGSTEIVNCTAQRCDRGVVIQPGPQGSTFHNHVIHNCVFENIYNTGILVWSAANNLRIDDNRFVNVATNQSTYGADTVYRAAISCWGGTGHRLRGNHVDKGGTTYNQYSFDFNNLLATDIDVRGNYAIGYGSGKLGLRGDTGDPLGSYTTAPSIQSAFASKNYVD